MVRITVAASVRVRAARRQLAGAGVKFRGVTEGVVTGTTDIRDGDTGRAVGTC